MRSSPGCPHSPESGTRLRVPRGHDRFQSAHRLPRRQPYTLYPKTHCRIMSTSPSETSSRNVRTPTTAEELDTLKHDLMKAEVRLAKARATVVSAEIDIKVLNTRLKALMK